MFDSIVLVPEIPLRVHVVLRFVLLNNANTMSQHDRLQDRNLLVWKCLLIPDSAVSPYVMILYDRKELVECGRLVCC